VSEHTFKVRENRSRRAAARQGLALERSRRHDRRAPDFGRYRLFKLETGQTVLGAGQFPHTATLDEVEQYLNGQGQEAR
jgi:hypothetical protein